MREAPPLVGDPTLEGATLRVVVNGTIGSDETYVLDASGWRRLGAERLPLHERRALHRSRARSAAS